MASSQHPLLGCLVEEPEPTRAHREPDGIPNDDVSTGSVLRRTYFPDRLRGIAAIELDADNAFVTLRLDDDDPAARATRPGPRPDDEILRPYAKRQRGSGDKRTAAAAGRARRGGERQAERGCL